MNKTELFNNNWKFRKNDNNWEVIDLPHDWLIYDVKNLYEDTTGYYEKTFTINNDLPKHFLRFIGVYMDCSVYINKNHVGDWKFGYTSFEFEITDFLKNGENIVKVVVRHEPVNSRWYSGAGIYRNVYLISTNDVYIPYGGIYISTAKNTKEIEDIWKVYVNAEILGDKNDIEIHHEIYFENSLVTKVLGDFNQTKEFLELELLEPKIWNIENPNIYTLITKLYKKNVLIHQEENNFGIREISFNREKGFFLNGRHLKINGVCQHHDLGGLGAAFYPDALYRQFLKLKKMGVNALRTAHNPPDPYFMYLADTMGFLVVSELFDIWEKPKTEKDYSRFFNDWYKKDVASWVRRDRNHPSLIMWSVGNEIYDTHANSERGIEILSNLVQEVLKHDPKNNAYVTMGSNYLPWENTQVVADTLPEPKLIGYNYGEYLYQEHHKKYKDWIIYGSETGSVVQSRGIYHFPLSQSVLADDDFQCSSLGNSATSWGAKSTQICIDTDKDTPFSLGQFIWTGTDYIGEPTPYHTKNSYFGQIDTAGFEKDSFYIYKAAWNKEPMIYFYPSCWDFNPCQTIDVQIATNCHRFEVYLNDKLIGETSPLQIPYEPGTLKAVAYDEHNKNIAVFQKTTPGDVSIILTTKITGYSIKRESTVGLAFVEISAVDNNYNPVDNANNRLIVEVENGRLLALDNGDSTDYDQYQNNNSRRLFSGKLLAIVSYDTTDEQGYNNIKINAKLDNSDTSVRKIELLRSNIINKNNKISKIKAILHPNIKANLHWRVTDAAGIDTNIATYEVSPCGKEIILTAKGDGTVFVRCSTKNGREHISLISYLDFSIKGLGKAYINPYNLVSGGLYNRSNMPMTNGNERGVATLRDGQSQVGFADLDLGKIGADTIHIPIFSMTPDPFDFQIWRGMPDEGGELLDTLTYTSGTQWNTYITETYKLPKKLTGITTLCFVVNRKIHIKGFWFTKEEKEKVLATSFTSIYGDSYKIEKNIITQIGNNVTLEFLDMGMEKEPLKLIINGRCDINNTIHLKFDDGESQILEFVASHEYTTREFSVKGKASNKVSFIFLPGSKFDFSYFEFSKS